MTHHPAGHRFVAAASVRYVIVGAGPAGCVLANRLSADPSCRVVLLEAGGPDRAREIRIPAAFTKLLQTAYDWNYYTTEQPQLAGRQLYWPRGKTLGGSTAIHGQAWTRGHRLDYDGWAESCPGWSYDEVLPYFQRAEHRVGSNVGGVYGRSGPQFVSELRDPNPTTVAFLAACAELGMRRLDELNGPDHTGCSLTPVTQRRGLRHSAADAYLRPVRRRPNLTVVTGAHVHRILFAGTRATGVEYRDRDGVTQRVTVSGEVIVSGGAINSPQLLMLSGVGDPEQLRAVGVEPCHELVGVGANLQDHLACGVIVHCPKPVTLFGADSRAELARFLLRRRGMLTSAVNEAVAFLRSDPSLSAPDLELVWLPVPVLGEGLTPASAHGVTLGVELLQPDSRGHLRLASADPAEPPLIDPGLLSAESDLPRLVAGLRFAERIFDTTALRPYVGTPMAPWPGKVDDETLATFIREHAQTAFHPVGTCRMGTDDAAVVDPELRVRGLDGLRVVDASVMPRIIRGHTQAPTVMIAERAADLLRRTSPNLNRPAAGGRRQGSEDPPPTSATDSVITHQIPSSKGEPNMRTHPMVAVAALAIAWTAVSSVPAHPVAGAVQVAERCGGRTVSISGTNGSETLTGTAGADVILARGGNDVIRGLGGNDTICPGPGRDAVKGGAGNDTFVADPGMDGNDVFVGDAGLDQVSYTARTGDLSVTIDGAANDGEPGEADDVGLTVETVRGGAGDDRLVGSPNGDGLQGFGGDDVLIGGLGDDNLDGGDGDDELRGNAGDDFLDGEADNDTIVAAGSPDGADFVEGGSGIDTASYAFRGQNVRVSIDLIANDGAVGEGDNVQLDIEDIEGGSGNDQLIANFFQQDRNRLSGNAGSDFISVTDGRGGDIADGGSFNDLCITDRGDARISCDA